MKTKTAAQWRLFYAQERARLGTPGLDAQLDRAPAIDVPARGALVFPHTKIEKSGHLTAAVARAVVRSGAHEVLAIGVLHGGLEAASGDVERARAGDPAARRALRRVYEADEPFCAEEFSLDNFAALLSRAAAREHKTPPAIVGRFPFLVGDDPAGLPGMEELEALARRMPVVATTDPIHHGDGYGTPAGARRHAADAATVIWARAIVEQQVELLLRKQWTSFAQLAAEVRSDFRDDGPALAHLLADGACGELVELILVDYAETLGAEAPTWVAAPLLRLS